MLLESYTDIPFYLEPFKNNSDTVSDNGQKQVTAINLPKNPRRLLLLIIKPW